MQIAFTLLIVSFQVSLFVTVFAYALRARAEDLRGILREPRLLILSLLAIFVLTPALAIALVETIELPTQAAVALVAISLSIIPPLLPQKELAAGGDRPYAIGLTVSSAVLAVVIVPYQVHLLGEITDKPYGVPTLEVASAVLSLVVAPLVLGALAQMRWPDLAERFSEPATKAAGAVTGVALVVVMVVTLPIVLDLVSVRVVLAFFLFNVGALAIGHLVGGPDPGRAVVLGLSCASRHPSIALTIASVNFPGEQFTAAVILCLTINAMLCGPYVSWMQRRGDSSAGSSSPRPPEGRPVAA